MSYIYKKKIISKSGLPQENWKNREKSGKLKLEIAMEKLGGNVNINFVHIR